MKNAYPIVLTKGEKNIVVSIPDFGIGTQGMTIPDAIEMARDAIGLLGIDMEDDGEELPASSDLKSIIEEHPSDIVSLVDVDFSEYRRRNDMKTVKKNCTLPSWLCVEAEKAKINFSQILQAAIKKELGISDDTSVKLS